MAFVRGITAVLLPLSYLPTTSRLAWRVRGGGVCCAWRTAAAPVHANDSPSFSAFGTLLPCPLRGAFRTAERDGRENRAIVLAYGFRTGIFFCLFPAPPAITTAPHPAVAVAGCGNHVYAAACLRFIWRGFGLWPGSAPVPGATAWDGAVVDARAVPPFPRRWRGRGAGVPCVPRVWFWTRATGGLGGQLAAQHGPSNTVACFSSLRLSPFPSRTVSPSYPGLPTFEQHPAFCCGRFNSPHMGCWW